MNPGIIFIVFFALTSIGCIIGLVSTNSTLKKLKTNWFSESNGLNIRLKEMTDRVEPLKRANEELKKMAEELQSKLAEAQTANDEYKKKEEEDAKREEENAKAFEDVQALLKEAEETNEVLLKCISGEITMLEATAQLGEIRKTSVVQEEPVEEKMEARG